MDNIFGDRFVAVHDAAWHKIGHVLPKPIKPSKAVAKYGLDYPVSVEPAVVVVSGQTVETGKLAIMRAPTKDDNQWRTFGMVGQKYELVQNAVLAKIMDPLAEVWGLETVGALDNGKTIFMTFNTGDQDIHGDAVKGFFLVVDVKDGGTSIKCVYTPIRVVCQNTLVSGLRQATVAINLQHLTGAKDQLQARVNLIAKAKRAIDETTAVFRQLAETKVTPKQVELMFDNVYPLPRLHDDAALVDYSQEDLGALLFKGVAEHMYDYNYYVARAQTLRAGAADLYEKLNDEYPRQAGTAWHAWNAVVESADFRDGGKEPEVSAVFGARAREKRLAFQLATSLIK